MKRSPSRGSQEAVPSPPGKKDSELEVILRRRRNKAGEAGSGGKCILLSQLRVESVSSHDVMCSFTEKTVNDILLYELCCVLSSEKLFKLLSLLIKYDSYDSL